jgi:hypothetical protein
VQRKWLDDPGPARQQDDDVVEITAVVEAANPTRIRGLAYASGVRATTPSRIRHTHTLALITL